MKMEIRSNQTGGKIKTYFHPRLLCKNVVALLVIMLFLLFLIGCAPKAQPELIIEGEKVKITLPSHYVGSAQKDFDSLIKELDEMGGNFANMAQFISAYSDKYLMYAVDATSNPSSVITSMNMTWEENTDKLSSREIAQDSWKDYQEWGFEFLYELECDVNPYECTAIVIKLHTQQVDIKVIQYFILINGGSYAVAFTVKSDEFEDCLPEFNTIVSTFKIMQL